MCLQIQTEHGEARRFHGIFTSLVKIGKEEGLRGYFKGNGTNVLRIVPYVAVQFAAYEEFKKVSRNSKFQSLRIFLLPPLPSVCLPCSY